MVVERLQNQVPAPDALGGRTVFPRRLDALFDDWFDRVYRFCLARTGSVVRAEEAASETFADAARLFADGRGDEVSEPWLFSVARRRVIDQWRSAERHRRRLEQIVANTPLVPVGPAEPVELSDDEHVRQALDALPERQRAAIVLRYVEEFSVTEVAEALEVGYQAAESLLARGRRGFVDAYQQARQR